MAPPPSDTDAIVRDAARALDAGGIVAFPTETVYGLGADASCEPAIERVFQIKRRPLDKPLTLHIATADMARPYAARWPDAAARWAQQFWPGPLTIILPRTDAVLPVVCAGGGTVGLRCPDHPLTRRVIEALGRPIVGPSANISGRPPATTEAEVRAEFPGDEILVLPSDAPPSGVASTVVSLAGEHPRILRAGAITARDLGIGEE